MKYPILLTLEDDTKILLDVANIVSANIIPSVTPFTFVYTKTTDKDTFKIGDIEFKGEHI
jgi:hypothetical protein